MSVGALCLAAGPLLAADGVLISEKSTTGGNSETHQIQIDKTRMRVETGGPSGEKQAFIFDSTKQVMWIVNYDKKTYSEMTKADVDKLGGQMSDAMAKMQQQMASLPPEQRAQMEKMMAGRGMPGAGAPAAKTEYKKTGSGQVGKWTCDKYEGTLNGQKTSELCTVQPQALGLTPADFDVALQLQSFFAKIIPAGRSEDMFRFGKAEDQGFSGVPVRRESFGPRPTVSEITDVKRESIPDSVFALPAGFQKEASPFGGRPGRGPGL